ncbi:predicted protein [Sclerotinia sclerotiorum 1980 UF-70]|uniref:Uncharacterized protein n=1 Tax=Sclerotinia sclerotiorum (strain ATCC 18683 / 1980 / Ss-1) TaxID=665079 RepID=A7F4U1_SCLS1|nr:predicted protein [Sclerotinia sclerotiorum 1980 UF-70]EDN97762.1 predicted protein [Sclerotinia sclerotiorum 1980 UF-70]
MHMQNRTVKICVVEPFSHGHISYTGRERHGRGQKGIIRATHDKNQVIGNARMPSTHGNLQARNSKVKRNGEEGRGEGKKKRKNTNIKTSIERKERNDHTSMIEGNIGMSVGFV